MGGQAPLQVTLALSGQGTDAPVLGGLLKCVLDHCRWCHSLGQGRLPMGGEQQRHPFPWSERRGEPRRWQPGRAEPEPEAAEQRRHDQWRLDLEEVLADALVAPPPNG